MSRHCNCAMTNIVADIDDDDDDDDDIDPHYYDDNGV